MVGDVAGNAIWLGHHVIAEKKDKRALGGGRPEVPSDTGTSVILP
jgi:hypothetical protein